MEDLSSLIPKQLKQAMYNNTLLKTNLNVFIVYSGNTNPLHLTCPTTVILNECEGSNNLPYNCHPERMRRILIPAQLDPSHSLRMTVTYTCSYCVPYRHISKSH